MILDHSLSTYILIYLIIPAIFVYNFKLANGYDLYLGKKDTDNLRGIAITVITIHHLVSGIENQGLLAPFIGLGYLGVSIFLFLSGYGLTFSFLNNENYLESFFLKRITKIFIPFISLNLIHLVINIAAYGTKYTLREILLLTLGIKLINGSMWYIHAILFWYISFYILFKFFKIRTIEKLIFAAAFGYFIFCKEINLGKYWFDSAFAFPIGVLFCLRKDNITSFIKRYFNRLALVSIGLFTVLFIINQGKTSITAITIRSMASVMFVLLICLFMYKVDISGSKVLAFLGSISFEIYLIHPRFLQFNIVSLDNRIGLINIVFYLVITIVSAFFINKFNLFVNTNINKLFMRKINGIQSSNTA